MGVVFCLVKWLLKWSIYFALFFALVVFVPNLPPYTQFTAIKLEPTQIREGSLAPNGALNNAQKLYKGKLVGPEAFQVYQGEVYTSVVTGELVKLSPGGHVTFVAKLGNPCTGLHEEEKCGRPLDFEINEQDGKMTVADAYYGIWKVDIKTGKKQLLVSPSVKIAGQTPKIFNSIAMDKNGDFFWTDSCTDFSLHGGTFCTMSDPSGRLLHYNAAKNSSTVLVDKLWLANGVAVSPDRQFVVVAETARYRLMKHYLAGPKKGKTEVFVAGLPGTPDNVRSLPDGSGVLIGLYTVFDKEHPLLMRTLAQTPLVRKFVARLMKLAELPFTLANTYFPHIIFQTAIYKIGNFASLAPLLPPMSGLVQVDWNGNIVASYFNTDKSLSSISDAIVFKDQLYIGSPYAHDFVGVVPAPELLKKAFKSQAQAKQTKPVQATKPEVEKPVKPVQAKPAEKPAPMPKVAEVKPTPKPVKEPEVKPAAAKPKATETKPVPAETVQAKPVPAKPTEAKPAAKPVESKPAASKPVESKPVESKPAAPKPVDSKPEVKPTPKPESQDKRKTKKATEGTQKKAKKTEEKPVKEQIPIVEEIPSDTVKPSRETLKVIKREGPTEIPNPHV